MNLIYDHINRESKRYLPEPKLGESITLWWKEKAVPNWFLAAFVFMTSCKEQGLLETADEIERIMNRESDSCGYDWKTRTWQ